MLGKDISERLLDHKSNTEQRCDNDRPVFFWEGSGIISYSCCNPEIEIKKKIIEGTVYEDTYKEEEQQRQRATKLSRERQRATKLSRDSPLLLVLLEQQRRVTRPTEAAGHKASP
jgi:hypothetical protein